ncbi:DNA replication/repair protein RecF [Nocardioides limicola]|uniref:DNA replication/repair protein RecF n=1 Tax=Nocardioides limicola TaxID=2803368 RepID=UPI00193B830C|nr:DNA replication/repair protein RecF [Nocardioides sp. DJM-14]
MHIAHLTLHDFRSYGDLDLALEPGRSAFLGRNGQGKTNLVEAIDYLSRLASHRVASDAPLVRAGAEQALVRAAVVKEGRTATLEVELNPGRANRARINRAALPRPRDLIGLVRTVVFAPDDLALVKGDPSMRRRFLDDLLVLRTPRLAGVRADYDRVLKQRNSLLRSARSNRAAREAAESTLDLWNEHLVAFGAELTAARLQLDEDLAPYLIAAYADVADGVHRSQARTSYRPSWAEDEAESPREIAGVAAAIQAALEERRRDELDRGITLVGPHRDEWLLTLGDGQLELPVKGYASHGESWSFALALRLASYDLLRDEGEDPILILDDVFAELDQGRRDRLADRVLGTEQVLVTAAVPDDVPMQLDAVRYEVSAGEVRRQ